MPAPIIFSTTGAALTSEEISFAQQVAASFSLDMNRGWIKIVRRIDPVSGVLVEYHPYKNTAYTTPGGATDYVAMSMPNPVPYRGVSIGVVVSGVSPPGVEPPLTVYSTISSSFSAYQPLATPDYSVYDPATGATQTFYKTAVAILYIDGIPSGSGTVDGWSFSYPGEAAGGYGIYTNVPAAPVDLGDGLGSVYIGRVNGVTGTTYDIASRGVNRENRVTTYQIGPTKPNPAHAVWQAAKDAYDANPNKTYCMASDGTVLASEVADVYSASINYRGPQGQTLAYGAKWSGGASVWEWDLQGMHNGHSLVFTVPEDCIYPIPVANPVDWPGTDGTYYPGSDGLYTQFSSEWQAGVTAFNARHKAWFKKNSDEFIAALKTGFAPGTTSVTRAELQLGKLPSAWDYQIKLDVDTKYNSYTPTNTIGRKTKRTIQYSEVYFSETTQSDTSAGLTQAGVKVTKRMVTLSYQITVNAVVETREQLLTGYLTQTVTRHNNSAGAQLGLSRRDVYDNWYNREATSLPSGVPGTITAPYLKDRTTSRIGVVLNGAVQNGYNADSTLGTVGNPLTYALYVPAYPAASSTVTATVPEWIEAWHKDAKITYDKDGVGASNALNDSAMHGVKEVHITPIGAYLSESLGIFPDSTTAQDATQVELFGTAVYRFDWQTGALTFKSWKARTDANGNTVASELVDLPAGVTWGDFGSNCIITYKSIHWPDVVTALKVRDKALPTATATSDKVLYTIIQAIKAG